MATKTRSKRRRSARRTHLQKPTGVIHPRVEAVGPERFGIVSVDCAKARSKWMLADFMASPVNLFIASPQPNFVFLFRESSKSRKYEQRKASRQEKLGKGGRDVGCRSETFRRNPAGEKPAQESLTNTWKRVLLRSGATHPVKRRQRLQEPCYRASKFSMWEPSL